tara:strand:- start:37181 stop:37423 length:243 start_codon:yes stop_codon:yes gene_type:complete
MVKYKIIFDREGCIGALACAGVAEEYWIPAEDGKVDLKGATFNEETKKWELIVGEEAIDVNKVAVDVCPVQVIIIEKIED